MDGKNAQRASDWLRFHGAPPLQPPAPPSPAPLDPVQDELARMEREKAGLKE